LAEQGDLSFFNDLLAEYSHKNDVSPEEIASALAYLLQKERPLQAVFTDIKPERGFDRGERSDRGDRGDRGPRSGRERPMRDSARDENMQRYRIEVGRNHEARPGDIVGAIRSEEHTSELQSRENLVCR